MGPGLRVVLLSDHGLAGGRPLRNVLPAVRRALERRGLEPGERLEGPRSVVLTPFGLVSSLEAYSAPELAPEIAATLAGLSGIELCVHRDVAGWRFVSAGHSVRFERRRHPAAWRWEVAGTVEEGVAAVLAGVASAGTWVTDETLLEVTANSEYPDALYRLAGAFEAVDNPASVVCSLEPGHMYGSLATERSARWTKGRLRWTHGSLRREASLGFLMSDRGAASGLTAVRYDRALEVTPAGPYLLAASP
jgi:hypothetical protein